ncbi:hypothetical protein AWY96_01870 [Serratia plymuthica]|nr:hypothetical protein AWY96_01870 [Serratia plymuthica]
MNIPKLQSVSRSFLVRGGMSAGPTLFKFILQLHKWERAEEMNTSSLRAISILGFSAREAFNRCAFTLQRCGIVQLKLSEGRITSVRFTRSFIDEVTRE